MKNSSLPESWFVEVSRLAPPFANDETVRAFSSAVESAVYTTDLRAVRLLFRCLSKLDDSGVQTTLSGCRRVFVSLFPAHQAR